MHILDLLKKTEPSVSFEFFPPKTEKASGELLRVISELSACSPSFVSVTYGAGGSTRSLTHDLVKKIIQDVEIPAIPHLTCVSHTEEEITAILKNYTEVGVGSILALRGDPPRDQPDYDRSNDSFPYAEDLVRFISKFNSQSSASFGIGVAGFPEGHPETPNRLQEMDYLKQKIDAGADYICTQLFFDNHSFFDYRERCELAGINAPIIAGIMPLTTLSGMKRMAQLSGGSNFPAALQRAVLPHSEDARSFEKAGIEYAITQCRELIDQGIDGLHFYTLNKSPATLTIARSLDLA